MYMEVLQKNLTYPGLICDFSYLYSVATKSQNMIKNNQKSTLSRKAGFLSF